jgi:hypothetical protein
VVAVDHTGRQLDQTTVAARTLGHGELLGWARRRWPEERVWAVEDCRHVTGRLERDLLAAGERVVRVPPRLMAGARHAVPALGKSDPIDALAVARAACANPTCPPPAMTSHPGKSGCWSTTASTWSPSGPGRSTGCAGTCINSTPTSSTPPDPSPAGPWTRSPPGWPAPRGRPGRHLPGVDRHHQHADGAHRPAHR